MSHIVNSDPGMAVQRLMKLVDDNGTLNIHICWSGLPESEDTLEPLPQVYQEVSVLVQKLLARKITARRPRQSCTRTASNHVMIPFLSRRLIDSVTLYPDLVSLIRGVCTIFDVHIILNLLQGTSRLST